MDLMKIVSASRLKMGKKFVVENATSICWSRFADRNNAMFRNLCDTIYS